MAKINQGYPGDLLSARRKKFQEDAAKMISNRNRHKIFRNCGVYLLILILAIICILAILNSQGHSFLGFIINLF